MKQVLLNETSKKLHQRTIKGWIWHFYSSGSRHFIALGLCMQHSQMKWLKFSFPTGFNGKITACQLWIVRSQNRKIELQKLYQPSYLCSYIFLNLQEFLSLASPNGRHILIREWSPFELFSFPWTMRYMCQFYRPESTPILQFSHIYMLCWLP